MIFWLAVAILSAAVTYAVTRPLLRAPEDYSSVVPGDPQAFDTAVYKDQLAEIDADAARGTMTAMEAEAARAEVARRLLRTSAATGTSGSLPASATQRWIKPIHLVTSLAIPAISVALYIGYGSPGLPGAPLKERLTAPVVAQRTDDLIAKVEARLRDHPDDGKGWDVIAPVYLARGQYNDAAKAFASAMKLLGENPARLQGFASARIAAENGMVPDDARKALQTLVASDPKLFEPRIWLALAKEQDGKTADAMADYRGLLAEGPADAPWRGAIQARLSALDGSAKVARPAAGSTSSDPAKPAAVEGMSPAERDAMINRMVTGLAERMKLEPKDKDGWQKLIRAYAVLGRKDDASRALADAKSGLAGDAAALAEIEQVAKEFGVGG